MDQLDCDLTLPGRASDSASLRGVIAGIQGLEAYLWRRLSATV